MTIGLQIVYSWFCSTPVELSGCNRDLQMLKYLPFGPHRKPLSISTLRWFLRIDIYFYFLSLFLSVSSMTLCYTATLPILSALLCINCLTSVWFICIIWKWKTSLYLSEGTVERTNFNKKYRVLTRAWSMPNVHYIEACLWLYELLLHILKGNYSDEYTKSLVLRVWFMDQQQRLHRELVTNGENQASARLTESESHCTIFFTVWEARI